MNKVQLLSAEDVYCIQASIGAIELCCGEAAVFRGASQKEILEMTKRKPLFAYELSSGQKRPFFIDDGTHRLYMIRFHSGEPRSDIKFYAEVSDNIPYSDNTMRRIMEENRTVENIGYRA